MSETVQSVTRAFEILRVLAAHDDPVPLRVIAAETGLSKSTVSRLLATLESFSAVERGFVDGTYAPGKLIPALAGRPGTTSQLLGVAHAYLVDLVERYGEDSALAVPDGDRVIYTDQAQSSHPIQVPDWTRRREIPHTVAAGFVMMAWWPPPRLEDYLSKPLVPATRKTLTHPEAIRNRLAVIRKRGYIWAVDEWIEGITAVAAPILNREKDLVAIVNVFGPSFRWPGKRDAETVGKDVFDTANRIARHLR
ncbi:MAG TPA: IclR family transcriptional regulator [Acidimicrobiia bacterium]|nr:IclR family transcriptional regulator [Acidimicrobiia bacterium]